MGSKENAGDLVLDQLRSSLDGSRYSLTAVYAAILVAFGGAAAILLGILVGWHGLQEVYASRPLLASRLASLNSNQELSKRSAMRPSLKQCLKSVWSTGENEMRVAQGLDAVVYIRALRMMRNIFALLTLVLFSTAAPINIVFNIKATYVDNLTKRDALLLLTPTLLSKNQLIPHVVLGWVTNAIVFAIIWYNYRRVLAMRQALFDSPEFKWSLSNRTLVLTDMPRSLRSSEGIARVLNHANPHADPEAIAMGHKDTAQLNELLNSYESKVIQLEHEMLVSPASSKCRELSQKVSILGHRIDSHRSMLSLNQFNLGEAGDSRTSLMSNYSFASYANFKEAQETVRNGRHHNLDSGIHMQLTPPPEQLIWKNLNLTAAQRGTKQLVINLLFGTLLLLWIVPSAFIGCFLANLNRLGSVWPAFSTAMQQYPVAFAILQGVMAPFITTLIFAALPMIFRKFSHMQGKVTRFDREHEVLRKLYAFFFLDNFFLFTLMGVIWDVVAQVLQQTQSAQAEGQKLTFREVWNSLRVAQRIATAIVNLSSFWVLYLLRGIFALFGGAAQPVTLLSRLGLQLNFIQKPTPRERAENSMPQPFQYAVSYLSILFNATIALGFTTIQPLVLPVTLILFALSVPVKKYMLLHMQATKYESNGMFWPLVCDLTLFSLGFGNLILLCVVWVQAGWQVAVGASPLAVTVIIFKIVVYNRFESHFYYSDSNERLFEASEKPDVFSDDETDQPRLCEYYEDPACHTPLDKPLLSFEDALWYYANQQRIPEVTRLVNQRLQHQQHEADIEKELHKPSDPSIFENPFEPPEIAPVGAVWLNGSMRSKSSYSLVEPYPSYEGYEGDNDSFQQTQEMNKYAGRDPGNHLLD